MNELKMCIHSRAVVFCAENEFSNTCPLCATEKEREAFATANEELQEEAMNARRDLIQAEKDRSAASQNTDKIFAEKQYWCDEAQRLIQELNEIKSTQEARLRGAADAG